ncbi:PrgI family protein [Candidatus Roizmanbacteria bacterium]|nr:PrgI family protein [Candidatus Roizmanbacteria bacterium]
MKATIVPAEVTSVEDKITANLSMSQLILFAMPMFIGALMYWILPPSMDFSPYKLVVIGLIAVTSFILAIRINGKIVLLWLITISRYNRRPKFYLFDKRSIYAREDYPEVKQEARQKVTTTKQTGLSSLPKLSIKESDFVYSALNNPIKRLNFETNKKGELNVRITEVQG